MKFNVNQPQERDTGDTWQPLQTGQYIMRIAEAKIAPSPFTNDDGENPDELTIVWQLAEWNEDYADAGYQDGQKVFQRFNPWYGESRKGPSKFKQFIDPLIQEGLIPTEFEVAQDDLPADKGDLIGITRQVMVEHYTKSMGVNKGSPGNRVLAVTAPRTVKSTVKEVIKNGGRVNLDDVDAADAAQRSPNAEDLAAMTQDEMVEYAKHLASQVGSFWAKKHDWHQQPINALQGNIRRMEAKLSETPVVLAEDDQLF